MCNRQKTKLNAQFVFSNDNQVLINSSNNREEWYPINFQWIPVIKLHESMEDNCS